MEPSPPSLPAILPPGRRALPSVDKVLGVLGPVADLPRPVVVAAVRRELAARRARLAAEPGGAGSDDVAAAVTAALARLRRSRLQPVINGTGVLLHTNLGRAPLGPEALATVTALGSSYNNLEFDLETGERGGRAGYPEAALALLCGAEAAAVVNNCAAALVLILRHFSRGARKEVLVSRGELVQIGGGFRIPEILEESGARLREVGTTNRTTVEDYARAVGPDSALILKVHRSNFYLGGFTAAPAPAELAALARRRRLPFVEDLGSGAVTATERHGRGRTRPERRIPPRSRSVPPGVSAGDGGTDGDGDGGDMAGGGGDGGAGGGGVGHERTPAESIREGVELVCFSGDKLFGGPQAGLIVGRARHVRGLKREPFYRALRCDKLILGALQATVDLYLAGQEDRVPAVRLLGVDEAGLRARAARLVAAWADLPLRAAVGACRGRVGGGTMPRAEVPSVCVELDPAPRPLTDWAARLRAGQPPVIGQTARGRFRIDLRTVLPEQDESLARAVRAACGQTETQAG